MCPYKILKVTTNMGNVKRSGKEVTKPLNEVLRPIAGHIAWSR
jgi:hypothetical protein